jgi:hypothetical protein
MKKFLFLFCSELYWFSYEGKPYKITFRFVVYSFPDQTLCSSTSAESVKKLFQLKLDREDAFQWRRQKGQLANIIWFGKWN